MRYAWKPARRENARSIGIGGILGAAGPVPGYYLSSAGVLFARPRWDRDGPPSRGRSLRRPRRCSPCPLPPATRQPQRLAEGHPSSGATAATIARSCGRTFAGSNLRTFAVIRVSNSDIVIGGFSPFFDGIQRTGLQRATTT